MRKPKIGLLFLYLELYDEVAPEISPKIKEFAALIKKQYENRNIEIAHDRICCIKNDFTQAIQDFEKADVDAIITLHLAYSPSLESIDAISKTDLPIIILDTTPDYDFGFNTPSEKIMFNHGIHGVQDFCNLLIRHNKEFILEVGHWEKSDVIERTISCLKGIIAAKNMSKARVGIIGKPFAGMGDFAIPFDILKETIGFDVISTSSEDIAKLMPKIDAEEVQNEMKSDIENYTKTDFLHYKHREITEPRPKDLQIEEAKSPPTRGLAIKSTDGIEKLELTEATCLGVRKWIKKEKLDAFTMNFLDINGTPGLPLVPFIEASKGMTRGIGYAGEGDVLTAVLCGSLLSVIPETTFTEMFCPDWKGNRIFMSHMGEINANLTSQTACLELKPYPFSKAKDPVVLSGCLKPGNAYLVNIAPSINNRYSLIVAPVEVCDTDNKEIINSGVRAWIKPQINIDDFLKQYSLAGGTHHKVLCYTENEKIFEAFAKFAKWHYICIK